MPISYTSAVLINAITLTITHGLSEFYPKEKEI